MYHYGWSEPYICRPYMTVYLVISLPKIYTLYVYRVMANKKYRCQSLNVPPMTSRDCIFFNRCGYYICMIYLQIYLCVLYVKDHCGSLIALAWSLVEILDFEIGSLHSDHRGSLMTEAVWLQKQSDHRGSLITKAARSQRQSEPKYDLLSELRSLVPDHFGCLMTEAVWLQKQSDHRGSLTTLAARWPDQRAAWWPDHFGCLMTRSTCCLITRPAWLPDDQINVV